MMLNDHGRNALDYPGGGFGDVLEWLLMYIGNIKKTNDHQIGGMTLSMRNKDSISDEILRTYEHLLSIEKWVKKVVYGYESRPGRNSVSDISSLKPIHILEAMKGYLASLRDMNDHGIVKFLKKEYETHNVDLKAGDLGTYPIDSINESFNSLNNIIKFLKIEADYRPISNLGTNTDETSKSISPVCHRHSLHDKERLNGISVPFGDGVTRRKPKSFCSDMAFSSENELNMGFKSTLEWLIKYKNSVIVDYCNKKDNGNQERWKNFLSLYNNEISYNFDNMFTYLGFVEQYVNKILYGDNENDCKCKFDRIIFRDSSEDLTNALTYIREYLEKLQKMDDHEFCHNTLALFLENEYSDGTKLNVDDVKKYGKKLIKCATRASSYMSKVIGYLEGKEWLNDIYGIKYVNIDYD